MITLTATEPGLRELLALATEVKSGAAAPDLAGATVALVSARPSAAVRATFEVAAHTLGARVACLDGLPLGRDETVADTARELGALFAGIALYGYPQAAVDRFTQAAGAPVWNVLSDARQPVQALADVLTMAEHGGGDLRDTAFCFVGDARRPIARSLLITGARLGMDVRVAAPRHRRPPAEDIAAAHEAARGSGARLTITEETREALAGAEFVYTAPWVDSAEPGHAWAARVHGLVPYRVTRKLMRQTDRPHARFMHPLPAVHSRESGLGDRFYQRFGMDGAEVTDEVFRSADSIVFAQAANRPHIVTAMLAREVTR